MAHLPVLSGEKLISIFQRVGYVVVRQRGSHVRLSHSNKRSITIPKHDFIGPSLLKKILRDAELSLEKFLDLLK